MSGVVALPSRVDLPAVGPLATRLRDGTARIDAGSVSHIGGLGLQLLIAAARSARAEGRPFEVCPRSTAFDDALAMAGLAPTDIESCIETEQPE